MILEGAGAGPDTILDGVRGNLATDLAGVGDNPVIIPEWGSDGSVSSLDVVSTDSDTLLETGSKGDDSSTELVTDGFDSNVEWELNVSAMNLEGELDASPMNLEGGLDAPPMNLDGEPGVVITVLEEELAGIITVVEDENDVPGTLLKGMPHGSPDSPEGAPVIPATVIDRRPAGPAAAAEGRPVGGGPATVMERRPGGPATVMEGRPAGPATVIDQRAAVLATAVEGRAVGPDTVVEGRPIGPDTVLEGETGSPSATAEGAQAVPGQGTEGWGGCLASAARQSSSHSSQSGQLSCFRGMKAELLPASGAEADIYLLKGSGGENRILKLYRYGVTPRPEALERFKEISARHSRHVVRVFDTGFDKGLGRWFELLEYARYGSLSSLLGSGKADRIAFEDIVSELCEAIAVLHRSDLVHRDIKPANVLVRDISPADLVLSDFGISSVMHDASIRATCRSFTPEYAPPEMDFASKAGDWWSLGMTLYECLTGTNPFRGLDAQAVIVTIVTRPVSIPEDLDPRRRLLLKGLLTRDMERRWREGEVRRWLAGESPQVAYEGEYAAGGASGLRPFLFMGREYRTLPELAAAMARDAESWRQGAIYLGRGFLDRALEERNQFDEVVRVESLSCNDSNEYVFRFVHAFLDVKVPIYRGFALTGANILAALLSTSPPGMPEDDFVSRTLNDGWLSMTAFLLERNIAIDDLFLNVVLCERARQSRNPREAHARLSRVLLCTLKPGEFFWGDLDLGDSERTLPLEGPPFEGLHMRSVLCRVPGAFLRAYELDGGLLDMAEFNRLRGGEFVLPPDIRRLLSSVATYREGVRELVGRIQMNMMLPRSAVPGGSGPGGEAVYEGTQEAYDDEVEGVIFGRDPRSKEIVRSAARRLAEYEGIRPGDNRIPRLRRFAEALLGERVPFREEDVRYCSRIAAALDQKSRRFGSVKGRFPVSPFVWCAFIGLSLADIGAIAKDAQGYAVAGAVKLLVMLSLYAVFSRRRLQGTIRSFYNYLSRRST
jgi:hypothetical protein